MSGRLDGIKVVAFDADDTLWINETFFREAEETFYELLKAYLPSDAIHRILFKNEMANLPLYGYGIKGFMLSMVETIMEVTDRRCDPLLIDKVIAIGKEMLAKPVELIDGIEEVLHALKDKYQLIAATKGDLLDQERKFRASGLEHFFQHIEIMSDKKTANYQKLFNQLDLNPSDMVMIGNSVKSDVLPILELGGAAIHVPFHVTWVHEHVDEEVDHPRFRHADRITEILNWL